MRDPINAFSSVRARVLEDMKTLCRKCCYRELSEMDNVFNTSAPSSAVEQEGLEYEDEEAKSNLHNTAAEMGLRTDDLVAGLHDNHGGDQAMPTERIHEDLSDLEHHLEPNQSEGREGPPVSHARKSEAQISKTSATETNAAISSDAQGHEPSAARSPAAETPSEYVLATGIQGSNFEAEDAKAPNLHDSEARTEETSMADARQTRFPADDHRSHSKPMQYRVADGTHSHATSGEVENEEKSVQM
ncbi:MAG: hypothetical protein Q9173_002636 [Seirophora scorigena]